MIGPSVAPPQASAADAAKALKVLKEVAAARKADGELRAFELAKKAATLDPTSFKAQLTLAYRRSDAHQLSRESVLEYVRAMRLQPHYTVRVLLRWRKAWQSFGQGTLPENDVKLILEKGPRDPVRRMSWVFANYFGRIYPTATKPTWPKTDPDSIRLELDRIALEDGRFAGVLPLRAHLAELDGERELADRDLDLFLEICEHDTAANRENMHMVRLARAMVFAAQQPKRAMNELEQIDTRVTINVSDEDQIAGWLPIDPVFKPLQGTPRFKAFLDRYPPTD